MSLSSDVPMCRCVCVHVCMEPAGPGRGLRAPGVHLLGDTQHPKGNQRLRSYIIVMLPKQCLAWAVIANEETSLTSGVSVGSGALPQTTPSGWSLVTSSHGTCSVLKAQPSISSSGWASLPRASRLAALHIQLSLVPCNKSALHQASMFQPLPCALARRCFPPAPDVSVSPHVLAGQGPPPSLSPLCPVITACPSLLAAHWS